MALVEKVGDDFGDGGVDGPSELERACDVVEGWPGFDDFFDFGIVDGIGDRRRNGELAGVKDLFDGRDCFVEGDRQCRHRHNPILAESLVGNVVQADDVRHHVEDGDNGKGGR